jgi:hypothetical protein
MCAAIRCWSMCGAGLGSSVDRSYLKYTRLCATECLRVRGLGASHNIGLASLYSDRPERYVDHGTCSLQYRSDMVHFKMLCGHGSVTFPHGDPTHGGIMDHGRISHATLQPRRTPQAHTHVALSSRWLAARRARSTAGGLHCPPPHSARAQAWLMATQRSRHSS